MRQSLFTIIFTKNTLVLTTILKGRTKGYCPKKFDHGEIHIFVYKLQILERIHKLISAMAANELPRF